MGAVTSVFQTNFAISPFTSIFQCLYLSGLVLNRIGSGTTLAAKSFLLILKNDIWLSFWRWVFPHCSFPSSRRRWGNPICDFSGLKSLLFRFHSFHIFFICRIREPFVAAGFPHLSGEDIPVRVCEYCLIDSLMAVEAVAGKFKM